MHSVRSLGVTKKALLKLIILLLLKTSLKDIPVFNYDKYFTKENCCEILSYLGALIYLDFLFCWIVVPSYLSCEL